MDMLILTLRVM